MKDGTVFDAGVVKGEKGEKGDRGEPGEPGEDGIDGEDGRNGKDGEDGINGKDGRDGINGSDGSDGRDGSNGRTSSLESYATGTDFGCYPNSEFDWVVGDERSALYGETVHISSITAVLISKNSFENSCSDPALRLHDAFTPYVIRVTVSGYTDASNAGKQIAIGLINLNWASSTEFEYVTVIGSDGTFTASHDQNWPVVPDLLFHTIYRGVV